MRGGFRGGGVWEMVRVKVRENEWKEVEEM